MGLPQDDNGVEIPFAGGFTYPFQQIIQFGVDFLKLASFLALVSSVISLMLGRGFVCTQGGEGEGILCSVRGESLLLLILAQWGLIAYFINRWFLISFKNQKFLDVFKIKFGKRDIQTAGFVLLYFVLWGIFGAAVYWLNVKEPDPNWVGEAWFFIIMSLIVIFAVFLLFNSVVLVRFLQGREWWQIKQNFWPLFDNFYKLITWFIFYLLLFMFFLKSCIIYFNTNSGLPLWLSSICYDFCFYFGIYLFVAIFVSSLQYQEKYLYAED